jgi:hypothetical protein
MKSLQILEAWREKKWRRPEEVWESGRKAVVLGRKQMIRRRSSGGILVRQGVSEGLCGGHVTAMMRSRMGGPVADWVVDGARMSTSTSRRWNLYIVNSAYGDDSCLAVVVFSHVGIT